jgi:hypothetical protein
MTLRSVYSAARATCVVSAASGMCILDTPGGRLLSDATERLVHAFPEMAWLYAPDRDDEEFSLDLSLAPWLAIGVLSR